MTGVAGPTDRPLAGATVLVPRSAGQASAFVRRLRSRGADVVEAPTISIQPPRDVEALAAAVARVGAGVYDWVAFTSPNAVEAVLAVADRDVLAGAALAVVGHGSGQALRRHGLEPALVPARSTAKGLAAALAAEGVPGRVLLPRADIAGVGLPRALEDAGWVVDEVEAYRTAPVRELPEGVAERLRTGAIDVVAFSSGSTARNLTALLGGLPHPRTRVASIGPSTSEVCRELGLSVHAEAARQDLDGLATAVVAAFRSR